MTAQTGSWIFSTSSPRNLAVPTRCTSRPGLSETSVRDSAAGSYDMAVQHMRCLGTSYADGRRVQARTGVGAYTDTGTGVDDGGDTGTATGSGVTSTPMVGRA